MRTTQPGRRYSCDDLSAPVADAVRVVRRRYAPATRTGSASPSNPQENR